MSLTFKKYLLLLLLAIIWYVSGWICIDWVLNYSVYQGMILDLWLLQIPFTRLEVSMSPWSAYYLNQLMIHAAWILALYACINLFIITYLRDDV